MMTLFFGALIIFAQSSAISWKDLPPPREVTEYSLYTQNAKGYMRIITDTVTYEGKPALRVIVITGLSNVKKLFVLRDSTLMYLDRYTWEPLYSSRHIKRSGYNASYEVIYDSSVVIKLDDNKKKREATYRRLPEMYDNQEIFLLLRRFPFDPGYEAEIINVIPIATTFVRAKVKTIGIEKIEREDGDSVEAFHITVKILDKEQHFYLKKDPPFTVMRYEDPVDGTVAILRKVPTGVVPKD